MKIPPDQESRDLARFETGKNIVVEAGAGTGKTTLLTDRLLATVLAGGPDRRGLPIEKVVALTFTEKAAGEIKDRLAGSLEDLLAVLESGKSAAALAPSRRERAERWLGEVHKRFGRGSAEVQAAAETALQSLDRAVIGTLHHFAARALRRHPLQAGIDPAFTVDEGGRLDSLFEERWALWLDSELGAEAPRRAAWLEVLALARLEDLETLARALVSPRLSRERLHAGPRQAESLAVLRRGVLAALEGKPTKKVKIADQLALIAKALERLESGRSEALSRLPGQDFGAISWPKSWGDDGPLELLERAARVATVTPEADLLVRTAASLVAPFVELFRAAYARRGWIGFDGLLVAARDLVRDDLSARRALKREFQAFLIDEFQDTDPLQGETLLFLGEREGGQAKDWRELEFEPGRLFVVGDPKQSIYQFRGADIRAYGDFTELLARKGALRCALQANFRSAPGILEAVNAGFATLMRPEHGLQPEYVPLLSGSAAASPSPKGEGGGEGSVAVSIRLAIGKGGEILKAADSQEAEAAEIARCIAENCGHEGSGRPYRFKDSAILLRSTSPLASYVEALKSAGIPYVIEAERFFYETQEVTDFLNLLRALDDPSDRLSLAGLLRSPLAAVEDGELVALSRALDYSHDPPAEGLPESTRARVASFYAILRDLRDMVGRRPLQELVGEILSRTFLLELSAAAYHRDQSVSNLFKFARMAAARGEAEGQTLKEYIAEIEREAADHSGREGESPLADERFDAVRVLTIHKSKGLEWPVVFLPNLGAPPSRGSGSLSPVAWDPQEARAGLCLAKDRRRDLAYALLDEERRMREQREAVRLLYVAMTRAKDRLILLGNGSAERAMSGESFAGMLRDAGMWPGQETEAGKAAVPIVRFQADAPAAVPMKEESVPFNTPDWTSIGELWKGRQKERDAIAGLPVFLRPSAAEGLEKRVWPPSEESEAVPAALLGQLCHFVLEHWDFRKDGDLEAALADAYRALAPVLPAAARASVVQARDILESFLGSKAAKELARANILGRELPLLFGEGAQVVRGSLDVLYEADGALIVADYKTDHVQGSPAKHAARYKQQGELYVKAVERALGRKAAFKVLFLRTGDEVDLNP